MLEQLVQNHNFDQMLMVQGQLPLQLFCAACGACAAQETDVPANLLLQL